MNITKVLHKNTCSTCKAKFQLETECGPSTICQDCSLKILQTIYGYELQMNPVFKVAERRTEGRGSAGTSGRRSSRRGSS